MDEFESYDSSYHEWVEQLNSWMDTYDHADRGWVQTLSDEIAFEVTDIFDNHFDIAELLDCFSYAVTNHAFVGENLGLQSYTQHGVLLYAFDEFNIEHDHHDGWWVEQLPEQIHYLTEDLLTRHYRFQIFIFVCINWWHIGVIEQPLEWWEADPGAEWNDRNMGRLYKQFVGVDDYAAYRESLIQELYIAMGGDPAMLEDDYARWHAMHEYIVDGMGNIVDIFDENGISIFGEFPDGEG